MAPKEDFTFKLPPVLATPLDIGKAERELEKLDEAMSQSGIRKGDEARLPEASALLTDLCTLNDCNLLQADDRQSLQEFLKHAKTDLPTLHLSFAAVPSAAFMKRIITWFRTEIHPQVLITVGLQPNLGAGCMLRTPNKYFDLSLRQHFENQRALLVQKLTPSPAANIPETKETIQ